MGPVCGGNRKRRASNDALSTYCCVCFVLNRQDFSFSPKSEFHSIVSTNLCRGSRLPGPQGWCLSASCLPSLSEAAPPTLAGSGTAPLPGRRGYFPTHTIPWPKSLHQSLPLCPGGAGGDTYCPMASCCARCVFPSLAHVSVSYSYCFLLSSLTSWTVPS